MQRLHSADWFAGLAAGLLAGVSAQFVQCGEYRPAAKAATCTPPPHTHTQKNKIGCSPSSHCMELHIAQDQLVCCDAVRQ